MRFIFRPVLLVGVAIGSLLNVSAHSQEVPLFQNAEGIAPLNRACSSTIRHSAEPRRDLTALLDYFDYDGAVEPRPALGDSDRAWLERQLRYALDLLHEGMAPWGSGLSRQSQAGMFVNRPERAVESLEAILRGRSLYGELLPPPEVTQVMFEIGVGPVLAPGPGEVASMRSLRDSRAIRDYFKNDLGWIETKDERRGVITYGPRPNLAFATFDLGFARENLAIDEDTAERLAEHLRHGIAYVDPAAEPRLVANFRTFAELDELLRRFGWQEEPANPVTGVTTYWSIDLTRSISFVSSGDPQLLPEQRALLDQVVSDRERNFVFPNAAAAFARATPPGFPADSRAKIANLIRAADSPAEVHQILRSRHWQVENGPLAIETYIDPVYGNRITFERREAGNTSAAHLAPYLGELKISVANAIELHLSFQTPIARHTSKP